jgi:hypothetical protein
MAVQARSDGGAKPPMRVGAVACVQTCGARHAGYSATGLHDPLRRYELVNPFNITINRKWIVCILCLLEYYGVAVGLHRHKNGFPNLLLYSILS